MGVSGHLRIALDEYDERIRTFVYGYETLLAETAGALETLGAESPTVVDLGVGTGALAEACLEVRPDARLVGMDTDPGMLDAASRRLAAHADRVELVRADFTAAELPACDAIVACISLHHVREPDAKRALYGRCRNALRPGGLLASGDCFPAADAALAASQRSAWVAHLERHYTPAEARDHLEAWAREDVYVPLPDELAWLRGAGFRPEVLWRERGFAVVAGFTA